MPTVKEKPILFSGSMVRDNRAGSKTCTRRTSGLKHINESPDDWTLGWHPPEIDTGSWLFFNRKTGEECWIKNPFGEKGDHLWVRETFIHFERELEYADVGVGSIPIAELSPEQIIYRADWSDREIASVRDDKSWKWTPSILMRREYSRDNLEITSTRPPERVQEISDDDAIAEGIREYHGVVSVNGNGGTHNEVMGTRYYSSDDDEGSEHAEDAFSALWDSTYGEGSWNLNWWVWPIEYKVI